jgi:hypothetical protein
MVCTSPEAFWSVLQLDTRTENQTPFTWESIFNSNDIKITMYNIDIIQSIVESPSVINPGESMEAMLRNNWVERFLKLGGFNQLLGQLQRALNLTKETIGCTDASNESSNIKKKFLNQMLKIVKIFMNASI